MLMTAMQTMVPFSLCEPTPTSANFELNVNRTGTSLEVRANLFAVLRYLLSTKPFPHSRLLTVMIGHLTYIPLERI
jgi:hypothetical protein